MIKNMKIKKSLILGYGVTIVISAIIIIASLLLMNNQRAAYESLLNNNIRAVDLADGCRIDSNITARYLRDALILYYKEGPIDINELNSTINQAEKFMTDLSADLPELQEICPKGFETLLNDYMTKINAWVADVKETLSLFRAGRYDEAADLLSTNCSPKLAEAGEAAGALSNALYNAKGEIQETQGRNSVISMVIIVVAMLIATLVVIRMALVIIKSIVDPVEQVHKALSGFSEGKLDIRVDYQSTSELGEMCDALRTSQNVLGEVIGDTCRLLEEMGAGNFDVRSKDANMYGGSLASILTSVRVINRSLSDALTQISQ
ncbi:MAG: MCP four helix bundle domain-containing protein, partial [Oscillospiraceae bacterium]|nr:MCP four helix bundle domain-containing protein [Oscillospiraceae bacterium]